MALTKEDLQAIGEITRAIVKEETQPQFDELKADNARMNQNIAKLEQLPDQIKAMSEGITGINRNIEEMKTRLDNIENTLDNAVIVKAAQ